MARKEKLLIGLDIGSHAVKVCQLAKTADGYNLVTLGSGFLPPGAVEDGVLLEPEPVSRVIASLFRNLKIKGKKVGISISGYSVIVKKINLEVMNEDELAEHIMAEAEQYIPFDIEDVYLDFQDLKTNVEEFDRTDVMLVAAKKEVVDAYLDMLQQLKLKTVLVDVDGFALENIYEKMRSLKGRIALVDIGAEKMNINIIAEGSSVLARDIVVGSRQLTDQLVNHFDIDFNEAEKLKLGVIPAGDRAGDIEEIFSSICTQWVLEIKKTIDLYLANNPDKPLEKLALSGGGSKVDGLPEFIGRETGLEVELFNPFLTMGLNLKKIDRNYIETVGPEMAIAAGIAIRKAAF